MFFFLFGFSVVVVILFISLLCIIMYCYCMQAHIPDNAIRNTLPWTNTSIPFVVFLCFLVRDI